MNKSIEKRKVDNLGRICIPKKYRKHYNWDDNEEIEIIEVDDGILLKKKIKEIDYEELIHNLLELKYGNKYSNYSFSNKDIKKFKNMINNILDSFVGE